MSSSAIRTQRLHRLNKERAARRNDACEQTDRHHEHGVGDDKSNFVSGELSKDGTSEQRNQDTADRDAESYLGERTTEGSEDDAVRVSTKRNPDSDLASPP